MQEEVDTFSGSDVLLSEKDYLNGKLNNSTELVLPVFDFSRNRVKYWERTTKRAVDIVGSSLGLIALAFFYPIIATCIKISSRGSVLFIQERIGLNGKSFRCYKFRTMKCATPDCRDVKNESRSKPNITHKEDQRVFAFGKFLRNTNIDELPQLFNILKGEMSLVGPRPYPISECRYWRAIIPNWSLRYSVKPGLTGWAQVTGYRGGTLDPGHMVFRLKRDFKYIERYTPKLDVEIIWRTAKQMVTRKTNAH